jgi:hypothetical protein
MFTVAFHDRFYSCESRTGIRRGAFPFDILTLDNVARGARLRYS